MPARDVATTMGSMHGLPVSLLLTTHDPANHAAGEVVTGLVIGIVVVLVLFVTLVAWWTRRGGSDDPGDGGGGGGGGDPPDPGPSGPPWWPEFEREFAEHVAGLQSDLPRSALAHRSQQRDQAPADEQDADRDQADHGSGAPAARHPVLEPGHPVLRLARGDDVAEQG